MRASTLKRAIRETRLGSVEPRALREIGPLLVANLRCRNLRCRASSFGVRRPEEWRDWADQKCGECGKRLHLVGEERTCMFEINAAVKVLRFRPIDPATFEPSGNWEYVPFEFAGKLPGSADAHNGV